MCAGMSKASPKTNAIMNPSSIYIYIYIPSGWAGTTRDALGSGESAEAVTSSELLVPAAKVFDAPAAVRSAGTVSYGKQYATGHSRNLLTYAPRQ